MLIGCFANLNALLDLLIHDGRPVRLVCAGTNGEITTEDTLCAGGLATGLWKHYGEPDVEDDQTTLAMSLFECAATSGDRYRKTLHNSRGGRNLRNISLESDIQIAAQWDTTAVVPEYSKPDRALRAALETQPDFPVRLQTPAID